MYFDLTFKHCLETHQECAKMAEIIFSNSGCNIMPLFLSDKLFMSILSVIMVQHLSLFNDNIKISRVIRISTVLAKVLWLLG